MYATCVQVGFPRRVEEATLSSGAGVIGCCNPSNVNTGNQTLVFCKSSKCS